MNQLLGQDFGLPILASSAAALTSWDASKGSGLLQQTTGRIHKVDIVYGMVWYGMVWYGMVG